MDLRELNPVSVKQMVSDERSVLRKIIQFCFYFLYGSRLLSETFRCTETGP